MIEKMRPHLLPAIVLTAFALIVYAGSLNHAFLLNWDDAEYVVQNPSIQGMTVEHLKDAWTQFYSGNYAPVQIVSYMVDYSLWGMRPAGFIATNILLHVACGILFFALAVRITRSRIAAFAASFIFLLHPVQVESVVWISQRKNLLAMFFFLISFHSYISHRRDEDGRKKLQYGISLAAFALALLSKSVTIVLPLALFLYDVCFIEKARRPRWIVDKIPFVLFAVGAALVAFISQSAEHGGGRMSYSIEGSLALFYTMLTVLVRYFALLVRPVDLSAMYMPQMRLSLDGVVAGAALFAFLLVVLGVYLYQRKKRIFFWFALFFVGLLPVSQIVPLVTLMNDRYLYFPMLGAAGCIGLIGASMREGSRAGTKILSGLLAALLLPLPWLSFERTAVWTDDLSLWTDITQKTPASTLAWNGLGMAYLDSGRQSEAADAFLQALRIDPNDMFALNNIGGLYNSTGKTSEARPFLLKVVELFPDNFNGLMNLGINYYRSQEFSEADSILKRALAVRPESPAVLSLLGDVNAGMNNPQVAERYYQQAVMLGGRGRR